MQRTQVDLSAVKPYLTRQQPAINPSLSGVLCSRPDLVQRERGGAGGDVPGRYDWSLPD